MSKEGEKIKVKPEVMRERGGGEHAVRSLSRKSAKEFSSTEFGR